MMLSLPLVFLIDMTFFIERLHFFKIIALKTRYLTHYFCRKKQYVRRSNMPFHKVQPPPYFFCMTSVFKGQTSLLQNNVVCFVQMFHSYWRHIAHIQPWPVSFKKCCIHPRILLHCNGFFVLLHFFIKWFTPCEGSFAHTCTNTFFKEYHNR